jgi:hypothetical protein
MFGVFVDPGYHRRGIGRKSFGLVRNRYPQVKRWTLDTPIWNTRTKPFYEGLGFVRLGILRYEPAFDLVYYELITDSEYQRKTTPIGELQPEMDNVAVEGTIEDITEHRITKSARNGTEHRVAEAVVHDDSGSIRAILHEEAIDQVNSGEFIRIERGCVTVVEGERQLSIGPRDLLAILDC